MKNVENDMRNFVLKLTNHNFDLDETLSVESDDGTITIESDKEKLVLQAYQIDTLVRMLLAVIKHHYE